MQEEPINSTYKRNCLHYVAKADAGDNNFKFMLPGGSTKFKTCSGGFATILLGTLVLLYAVTQFIVFWERSNYSIQEKHEDDILKHSDFKFAKDDGFTVAAAFVGNGEF